jgi:acetyl esterase/lipase
MQRRDFLALFGTATMASLRYGRMNLAHADALTAFPEEQNPASSRGKMLAQVARSLAITRNIPYAERRERTLHLSIYRPHSHRGKALPVILYFGLAAWQVDASDLRVDLNRLEPAPTPNLYPPVLVPEGYALVAAQVRSSNDSQFPSQIQDCQMALAWILHNAEQYGLDPTRVGLLGASASGHLVSLLALMNGAQPLLDHTANLQWPLPVKAVCCMSGFYDFEYYRQDPGDGSLLAQIEKFLGGPYEQSPEVYQIASPQHYLESESAGRFPAFFLEHGRQDRRVPYSQAVRFAGKLSAIHADSIFEPIDHYHHGAEPEDVPNPPYNVTDRRIEQFFRKHLKPGE